MKPQKPELTPDEIKRFLARDITSRVHAAYASTHYWINLVERTPALQVERSTAIEAQLAMQAIWEGRQAALRWLIEFAGISQGKNKKAVRVTRRIDDIGIEHFPGGVLVDEKTPEADRLAVLWNSISKATSHATIRSGHAPIYSKEIHWAVGFLCSHFQKTIYAAAGISLL